MNRIFVGKLKDNMREMETGMKVIGNLPQKGLIEGPFVFERNGIYYLMYPHVANKTERLEYATGSSPMGPFEHKGVVMDETPGGCWTNHHSIVEYKGQWYIFYHDKDLSPSFDKNRSIRADYLYFNEDGTIQKVTPTLRGVGVTDAKKEIQVDRYSAISTLGASVAFMNDDDTFGGWKTVLAGKYAWIRYNKIDFGDKPLSSVKVRASSAAGGTVALCLDTMDGSPIARVEVARNTDWNLVSADLAEVPSGIHDLIVMLGDKSDVEIDWIRFE
jgi:beta-xylosidase